MTLSRKRVLLIVIASAATVRLIAIGLVHAEVPGGYKTTAAASILAHGNATKVTEPSDRFIIPYAENSATDKVTASAKVYGGNALNSLPVRDGGALTTTAGRFLVKLESVTVHAMSTATVKLSGKLTMDQIEEFISVLKVADDIETVEPDLHVTALGNASVQDNNISNGPYSSRQQGVISDFYGINATNAQLQSADKGVTVAVVDNGVLTNHPDLEDQFLSDYDFISDVERTRDNDGYGTGPYDEDNWNEPGECPTLSGADGSQPSPWHGFHTTGTIATCTNNGDGVAGIALDAKIVPVRALGRCSGESVNIVDATTWASSNRVDDAPANKSPVQILNLSVDGARVCPRFYQKAVSATVERGSIVMAAAGNFSENVRNAAPASYEGVIIVGIVVSTGARPSFPSYGDIVRIFTPSRDSDRNSPKILSTTDKSQTVSRNIGRSDMVGTSQAVPHASGAIALVLATNPNLKTAETATIPQNTITPLSRCDRKSCGAGIANTASAVAGTNNENAELSSKLSARPSAISDRRTPRPDN